MWCDQLPIPVWLQETRFHLLHGGLFFIFEAPKASSFHIKLVCTERRAKIATICDFTDPACRHGSCNYVVTECREMNPCSGKGESSPSSDSLPQDQTFVRTKKRQKAPPKNPKNVWLEGRRGAGGLIKLEQIDFSPRLRSHQIRPCVQSWKRAAHEPQTFWSILAASYPAGYGLRLLLAGFIWVWHSSPPLRSCMAQAFYQIITGTLQALSQEEDGTSCYR